MKSLYQYTIRNTRQILTQRRYALNNYSRSKQSLQNIPILQNNNKSWGISVLIGSMLAFILLKTNIKIKCLQNTEKLQMSQQNQIQIYQLNKAQLVSLLSDIDEQSILIGFNKYFRNQNKKQFSAKLTQIESKAKLLGINKIYLVQKNQIKYLSIFQKWIKQDKQQKINNKQNNQQFQSYDVKNKQFDCFYLNPHFRNSSFKLQKQDEIIVRVKQIRAYQVVVNPSNIRTQIFDKLDKTFNLSIIIKSCPQYIINKNQNQCINQVKQKVSTLIQQRMLQNKQQQFRFYAITPNSKKDNSPILDFKKALIDINQNKNDQKQIQAHLSQNNINQKEEDTFVLRHDIIGKSINSMKNFKRKHYSLIKKLADYDKFLLFIKPRVFIISKANSNIDLYWYVTCLHRNKQPSISINNTDEFNVGKTYQTTNGSNYPHNLDLKFLRTLYCQQPQLNYVIINSGQVSQLIRHLSIPSKYVIFNLSSSLIYQKKFLPNLNPELSSEQNYNILYADKIHQFLIKPKVYDRIVMNKQERIDRRQLQSMAKDKAQTFVLRVCQRKCNQDINEQQLSNAYHKIINNANSNKQLISQNQANRKQNYQTKQADRKDHQKQQTNKENVKPKNWRNQVFRNTYWIDSYFHNVGLTPGNYIFENGAFNTL